MKNRIYLICFLFAFASGCGGGEGSNANTAMASVQATLPSIAQPLIPLSQGISFGKTYWNEGSTSAGGNGTAPVGKVTCSTSENFHIHAHLSILLDGEPLIIPAKIGLKGCDYELHTHDQSGIIHEETSSPHLLTLGDFFAVWGQSLQPDNVAGISGKPVTAFIIRNGVIQRVTSNLNDIQIESHIEIIICVGAIPFSLPSFIWDPLL